MPMHGECLHWPFHPYVLILYSFLQLYLFDLSTIACLKFPSGCEITGWPRRFIPVFLGAYQSARINFDILTFTYDYVYNFNLYFARASEGIHLHVLCISFSFKILVKKKIWWKTSLDILKKIEKSIVIGLFLEAHTHLKFIIIEKNLCALRQMPCEKRKTKSIWNCKVLYLLYSLTI